MRIPAIKEHHLYDKAYAKGKKAGGRLVSVYVLRDRVNKCFVAADPLHRPLNRVGLAVGKKVGCAVKRNRVKRIIRAAYREEKPYLQTGNLIVICARPAAADKKSGDLRRELHYLFGKLELLREDTEQPEKAEV